VNGSESLLEGLGKGRPLRADAARGLQALLRTSVGRDGLSRLFQPGFPGVRTYVLESRADPDQTVEITVVGVARDGAPVWTAGRVFLRSREGALEIHHTHDEVDLAYRSRNLIVDSVRREVSLLQAVDSGPTARITIDAVGVGKYLCALHGFEFADETEEGPSHRSHRHRDPQSDRQRLIEQGVGFLERVAARHGVPGEVMGRALRAMIEAKTPWDIAKVDLPGTPYTVPDGEEGLAAGVGRAYLLSEEAPVWRAALYLTPKNPEAKEIGETFRARQTAKNETRYAHALEQAREALQGRERNGRIKALEALAAWGAPWVMPEVRVLIEDNDRRVSTAARHTLTAMSGGDLPARILAYAEDRTRPARLRGLAYRVLAEHYPALIEDRTSMLRVAPDARLQRAIIPVLAEHPSEAGPELASLLFANPWNESEPPRPGLLELRVEIIERLALKPDPRSLPPLIAAVSADPPPSALEMLALTRALVAYPDPRARIALTKAAQRLDRPAVP